VSFMSHVFSQNEHPFGQCGHFNQVEPFEKPWFVVMMSLLKQNYSLKRRAKKTWFLLCASLLPKGRQEKSTCSQCQAKVDALGL
jgi:hypothetical protein